MKRRIASHYALVNGRLERDIIVDVDADGTIVAVAKYENIDRELIAALPFMELVAYFHVASSKTLHICCS